MDRAGQVVAGQNPVGPWDAGQIFAEYVAGAMTVNPAALPPVPQGDPCDWGVADCLSAFHARAARPSDVLARLAARISGHARGAEYLWQMLDVSAAEADRRYAAGTARPLEGVPVAVKAIIDVAKAQVTCGSWLTGDTAAAADAMAVARLRAAGAIPFAMAATTEYAAGSPFNPRHGTVTNPWDPARWTGGSSTGSAAALAARLAPLALGTDTGGSIRVPAAWCGITGLKPTNGLVPVAGVAPLSWTLDHVGPMARTAADLTHVLPVLARSLSANAPCADAPLWHLRLGVPEGWFDELADTPVLDRWTAALDVLADAGVQLVPFGTAGWLGDLEAAHHAAWDILCAELAVMQAVNAPGRIRQDKGLQARIALGEAVPATRYIAALTLRSALLARFVAAMDQLGVDLLVTPGVGGEAGRLDTLEVEVNGAGIPFQQVVSRNTMVFDFTGLPALMLPTGQGRHGLPVAMQIVGRPFADALCLTLGTAFQQMTPHHLARPAGP